MPRALKKWPLRLICSQGSGSRRPPVGLALREGCRRGSPTSEDSCGNSLEPWTCGVSVGRRKASLAGSSHKCDGVFSPLAVGTVIGAICTARSGGDEVFGGLAAGMEVPVEACDVVGFLE